MSPTIIRSRHWVEIHPNQSISQLTLMHNVSNTAPGKIVYEDTLTGRTMTYAGFRLQVRRTAYWLKNTMGLKPGQIVSIMAPSCIDYILAIHATWWAGGVVSTINHSLHPPEVRRALEHIRPNFLLFHDQSYDVVPELLDQKLEPSIQGMTLGVQDSRWPSLLSDSDHGEELELVSHGDRHMHKVCAAIVLSSGTTGSPKAIMLSHYDLVSSCLQLRADNEANWTGDQAEIFFPPLSHIYGIYVCATLSAWIGAYICVMERFNTRMYCQLMQDRKATLARLVPPIAKLLAEEHVVTEYKYPALQYFSCSAAPLNEKTAKQLGKRFPNVMICQTYGCTELSGPIAQSGLRDVSSPLISGGRLIANVELRLVNEDGSDVGASGAGELMLRSPSVMMGYKSQDTIVTTDVLPGGWYRSGDIGYVNPDGYIVITGRVKDLIKYKGFQVAPSELEELLHQDPRVREAAVCGIWDEAQATELPTAFVVLHQTPKDAASAAVTAGSLVSFAASRVSHYKRLRGGIVFLNELPKNSNGKVLKRKLKVPKTWTPEPKVAKL